MANDPCSPFVEPHITGAVAPKHHAVHHAVGRITHRFHRALPHASQPTAPAATACGRSEAVAGQPGGLPAMPAERVSRAAGSHAAVKAATAKAGLLSGGTVKAAAAVLGLAAAAGAGAAGLSPNSSDQGSSVSSADTSAPPSTFATTGSSADLLAPVTAPAYSAEIPRPVVPGTTVTPQRTAVPEPSSMVIFLSGMVIALAARWRLASKRRV